MQITNVMVCGVRLGIGIQSCGANRTHVRKCVRTITK